MPSRTAPTRFLTGAWRWDVPRRDVPVAASASSASVRTLEGPAPKRPSEGLMSAGIWISATNRSVVPHGHGRAPCPSDETPAPAYGPHRAAGSAQLDRQVVQVVLGDDRLVPQLGGRDGELQLREPLVQRGQCH